MLSEEKYNRFLEQIEKIDNKSSIQVVTESIKFLLKELLFKAEEVTQEQKQELEKMYNVLEKIKAETDKLYKFYEENSEKIDELYKISREEQITFNNPYYSYGILDDLYISPSERIYKLLKNLSNLKDIFLIKILNNSDDSPFLKLYEKVNSKKSIDEKIWTLKEELRNFKYFVKEIEDLILSYKELVDDIDYEVRSYIVNIKEAYLDEIDYIFWSEKTWNVRFLFKNSELLTELFDTLFNKTPKNFVSGLNFKEDILKIFSDKKFSFLEQDKIVSKQKYLLLKDTYSLLEKISNKYKKLIDNIDEIYKKKVEENIFDFSLEKEDKDTWYKINPIFTYWKKEFIEKLDNLKEFEKLDVGVHHSEVGNEQLLVIKKKYFSILYSIYEDVQNAEIDLNEIQDEKYNNFRKEKFLEILEDYFKIKFKQVKWKEKEELQEKIQAFIQESWQLFDEDSYFFSEKFNKKIYHLIKLVQDYKKLQNKEKFEKIKEKNKKNKQEKDFTYHYIIESWWEFWWISWFKKKKVTKPAKVFWKTIEEIIKRVKEIANTNKYENIDKLFPWRKSTLEWNFIVLWPWWWWKTALLNWLSYDKDIITIEVNKSDILSTWYGQTEKNIDRLWTKAKQLYEQTWKDVFLFFDEFDNYFRWTWLAGNGWPDLQKEFQTRLDGLNDFYWVHIIALSNVPHKIPLDIYRRMERTYVLDELTFREKIDMFYSRLEYLPVDTSIEDFFDHLKNKIPDKFWTLRKLINSGFYVDLITKYVNTWRFEILEKLRNQDNDILLDEFAKTLWFKTSEDKQFFKNIYLSTPKIFYQITEKIFLNYINSINSKKLKKLDTKIWRYKKICKEKYVKAVLDTVWKKITLNDFKKATFEVFKNSSVMSEIRWNMKFYELTDEMLKAISSNAFDDIT